MRLYLPFRKVLAGMLIQVHLREMNAAAKELENMKETRIAPADAITMIPTCQLLLVELISFVLRFGTPRNLSNSNSIFESGKARSEPCLLFSFPSSG